MLVKIKLIQPASQLLALDNVGKLTNIINVQIIRRNCKILFKFFVDFKNVIEFSRSVTAMFFFHDPHFPVSRPIQWGNTKTQLVSQSFVISRIQKWRISYLPIPTEE